MVQSKNQLMKRICLLLVFLLSALLSAHAQKCCAIFGVNEEITYNNISIATISLFRDDTVKVAFTQVPNDRPGDYWIEFDYAPGVYTIRAELEGFYPATTTFIMKTKRNTNIGAGTIFMKKIRERRLGEVTVRPTHIKMVMRGDTVVYDAAAFELANGSMLDALVAQLPGAELKDGQIKVNGEYISSLLVNGEDFFSGDPKVALENLPAYTVKNIKVYDRAANDAYLLGGKRSDEAKNMVMDVQLKKEYSVGWIGNVEGGYGLPHDRYMGKAFGLGYTDHLRLAAYGNVNDIKNTQSAGVSGGWGGGWGQEGELDVQMGGLDYLYKKNDWKLLGNAMVSHEEASVEKHKSSVSFFDTGDVYGRSASIDKDDKFHLITTHNLQYAGKRFFLEVSPSIDYLRNDYSRFNRQATFTENPTEAYRSQSLDSLFIALPTSAYMAHLLSRISNEQSGTTDWLIAGGTAEASISFPNLGDKLQLYGSAKYRRDGNRPFSSYFLQSGPASSEAGRSEQVMQSTRHVAKTYDYQAGLSYQLWFMPYQKKKGSYGLITPSLDYAHKRYDRSNTLYQYRENGVATSYAPSAFDPTKLVLDLNNTHQSVLDQNNVVPGVSFQYLFLPSMLSHKEFQINGGLRGNVQEEQLHYEKAEMDTTFSRTRFLWIPSVEFKYCSSAKDQIEVKIGYNLSQSEPSIYYGLRTVNDANPTNIYLNNADLKRTTTHQLSGSYYRFWKEKHQSLTANAAYQRSNRSIAQARYYDRNTGINTWRPENISGNWSTNGNVQYTLPFGEKECFQFQTGTSASYIHSVDYATETEELTRSTVKNLSLSENLGLTYRLKKHSFGVSGNLSWLNACSNLAFFDDISAIDVSARANCLLQLPFDFQLGTDINLMMRRGYSDRVLNTTDWIWNASLSKVMLRGNLTFKLDAVDILGQISQVSHALNAQGRTETWTNTMPRYVMLHLIWRFQVIPKKKL